MKDLILTLVAFTFLLTLSTACDDDKKVITQHFDKNGKEVAISDNDKNMLAELVEIFVLDNHSFADKFNYRIYFFSTEKSIADTFELIEKVFKRSGFKTEFENLEKNIATEKMTTETESMLVTIIRTDRTRIFLKISDKQGSK